MDCATYKNLTKSNELMIFNNIYLAVSTIFLNALNN